MVDFSWDFGGTYCKGLEESRALLYSPRPNMPSGAQHFCRAIEQLLGQKGAWRTVQYPQLANDGSGRQLGCALPVGRLTLAPSP